MAAAPCNAREYTYYSCGCSNCSGSCVTARCTIPLSTHGTKQTCKGSAKSTNDRTCTDDWIYVQITAICNNGSWVGTPNGWCDGN